MKSTINNDQNPAKSGLIAHAQGSRKNKKFLNLENSPDSEKFGKYVEVLNKYVRENSANENDLLKVFTFFDDISKKAKYQNKILETPIISTKIKEILLKPSSNPEIATEANKIILNISKNHNSQSKLIFETCLNFNCLFEILLVNLNTNLTYNLLMTFFYLTESKEILDCLVNNLNKKPALIRTGTYIRNNSNSNVESDDPNSQVSQLISKLELSTITRTFAEKILDDVISSNKKNVLLKILENLYTYNSNYTTKEAIEPLVKCLGNKSNDVVVNALKVLLFYTKDKNFHNDLLNANFIFRLVRTYKQGIDEMDVVIVKILYDLFDNRNLYEVLFENNVLLILSNYLMSFEVEKNEKYEEVIRNVFEIFKLINKNTDEESNKNNYSLQNPLLDDEGLQILIFKKAYSLAAFSKSETSILSCLSLLQEMLFKFSPILLNTDESVKSVIELVPPFFKNKNIDVIKYSLSIFEIILNKKSNYFQETYVQSSNQTFSIKSLVHSVINLVNEFFNNFELLSMSCRILVTLSDIPRLQSHFLQEPQITVLRVFNDNLLKQQRQLKKEKQSVEERLGYTMKSILDINISNNISENNKKKNGYLTEGMEAIKENENEKDDDENSKNQNHNFKKASNTPSPIKFHAKTKLKLASTPNETQKAVSVTKNNNNLITNANCNISAGTSKNEERDKYHLSQIEKKFNENISLIKDSFTTLSNLSKNIDNIEVLTLKGFLDVINEKLNDNDTETLPYVTRSIQGFCQGQNSINIILKMQIIHKILAIYKLYRVEDEKNKVDLDKKNAANKNLSILATTEKRLEVLESLKNILESDIKLQRTFIIEKGIEILLNDIVNDSININEDVSDQLNEMILRVIYVVSCNINKLFLIYFSSEENNMKNESFFNTSSENDCISENEESENPDDKNIIKTTTKKSKKSKKKKIENILESSDSEGKENKNKKEELIETSAKDKLLKIFKEQLSEKKFMNKLTEVGEYDINSLNTYKELIKIFINLYLNRYYLKYFTAPKNFDKVINIINNIMKKYKESTSNENNYEILKLVIIFLKFICEDENLIRKFLNEDVISILIGAIIENRFYKNIKEGEIEQFYYNFSLVLLRLTEFNGHIQKFQSFKDFLKTLEKLYDINSLNGKIYIISIIRNIIAEKPDFFNEEELTKFLNKIVAQKQSFIIYEFVELIKNLIHSRSMCKRMENVFSYLITEIKSPIYSADFKKKMLDLILCLSYENANIKDYSLRDFLTLVKSLDVNINQKTTLLILMNFSSLSNNFSFLMEDYKEPPNAKNEDDKLNLTKKHFIKVVDQLIDTDRFSQILIQRLLINITSIDGIDMSIINSKIMKVLLDILINSKNMQDNVIIFSLATLVNITNRNVLKFEDNADDNSNDINININDNSENKSKITALKSNQTKDKNKTTPDGDNNDSFSEKESDKEEKKTIIKPDNIKKSNNETEIVIVDYILEKIPNLTEIFKSLLSQGSLDVNSLVIMFCCNLLRKINIVKHQKFETEIIKCIEDYITNEKILNSGNNDENLLKTDSGKFLLISIIKYFICLSVENDNNLTTDVQKSSIPKIIMNIIKDNKNNKLKQFKIKMNDIKENTINLACAENQLTLLNLILLLGKKKEMNYYFGYKSAAELREYIEIFFEEFITNFSSLLSQLQNDSHEQEKLKNNKNLNNENNNNKNSNKEDNNINKINISPKDDIDDTTNNNNNNSEDKEKTVNKENNKEIDDKLKNKGKKNNKEVSYESELLKNQTIQNILISCLKILIEYLIDIDNFISSNNNDDNDLANEDNEKTKNIKDEMNIPFYNKISNSFESILLCILNESPQFLSEELKSLFIYILFLVFSNILENKEHETKVDRKSKKKVRIRTNLEENVNLQKWLMKIFINNKKSIQNDFFCLKIFTISIRSDNFPEIFYQSPKFIKKLMSYLKFSGLDKKKQILKVECERFLNLISFNPKSHSILYSMGVYGIFKSNLFAKVANKKNQNRNNSVSPPQNNSKNKKTRKNNSSSTCHKEDFILLLNMILNKNNKEFIKDDIKRILQNIFPSKDLANNLRVQLFDIYMNSALDVPNEKQFHEDYLVIFNLLYENLKDSFSEMIFLFDKFTKTYQGFVKKFLLEDKMIIKIFYDFIQFDKDFPSKPEELNCYLKILELYLELGEMSDDFKKMVQDFMNAVTKDSAKKNLRDINILHSILNFSFLFFVKYCEKKNITDDKEDKEEDDMSKENKKELDDEEDEEYDDSSSKENKENKKKDGNRNNKSKEKLKEFIIKYKFSKLIDNIIYNALNYNETKGVYILSMLIIQDDYKLMLLPLKEIGSQIFKKDFILGFFTKFINLKKLDIKEFVFVIHLSIILSNVDSNGIEYIEDVIYEIIKIYKKYLIKNLLPHRNSFIENNSNNSNNNTGRDNVNDDNGASRNNGGDNGIDNGAGNQEGAAQNENNDSSNNFSETVTSIYFFCDLVKKNELSIPCISKVLDFLIFIISDVKNLSFEQKEILVRYYQEILLNFRINSDEELTSHFNFLNKVHKDTALNFIENLAFGTILINTRKDILLNNINKFLNMVTTICLDDQTHLVDIDKKSLLNLYKFCKQICIILNFNSNNPNNYGYNKKDNDAKINLAFRTLDSYINKIITNSTDKIKNDEDLNKKYDKLKIMIQACLNA